MNWERRKTDGNGVGVTNAPDEFMSEKEKLNKAAVALIALVEKLELIHQHPQYDNIFKIAMIHGFAYTGPNYTEELKKAQEAIKELTNESSKE